MKIFVPKKRIVRTVLFSVSVFFVFVFLSAFVLYFIGSDAKEYKGDLRDFFNLLNEDSSEVFAFGPRPRLANADYFTQFRDDLVAEKATFIEVNLSTMNLRYYIDGVREFDFTVRAKGKEGTWWETPPGIYAIQNKIPEHRSSFGPVIMPWNLPFQGNFFIHGWPRYTNGNPATSDVSGGCIRLDEDDARRLFERVAIGTPVIIFDDKFKKQEEDIHYGAKSPMMEASSALAVDVGNNFVFLKKNSESVFPLGTISSLMSAVIASEYISMEQSLTAPFLPETLRDDEDILLEERYRVYDLLFPLLENWSEEAAYVYAVYMGERRFIDRMEAKRIALGMNNSHFRTVRLYETGALDHQENKVDTSENTLLYERVSEREQLNTGTSEDIFFLLKYIHIYRPFILDISSTKINTYLYGEPKFERRSHPRMFNGYDDFLGGAYDVERGHMVAVFRVLIDGKNRPVAFVVLDSSDPIKDVLTMREYVMSGFQLNK